MTTIHTFLGIRIAFYRPRKQTYYLLEWHPVNRIWGRSRITGSPTIVRHKTELHTNSSVRIPLFNGWSMTINSNCEYLLIDHEVVPIVQRVSGAAMPLIKNDFGGVVQNENYIRNVELWTLEHDDPVISVKPLPKRIAWIIADDASKNNEKCPITMEPISPITAAVSTCFHCFDDDAIRTWLNNNDTCPQCREKCAVTKAFD